MRIEIAPGVIAEPLPLGETLLMNVHTLAYFGLDEVGSLLWRGLEASRNPAEIARVAARETGIEEERLRATFEALLDGMERSGLVVRSVDNAHGQNG